MDMLEKPVGASADGWVEVNAVGTRVGSVITAAARATGVGTEVWAQPVLGGGMFELAYGDTLIGDRRRRAGLAAAFTAAGVLLLEGHPSFVCLAHRDIDWDSFEQRVRTAFERWSATVGGPDE
jgi:glutamate-1-semialdehyde 2,1-aminomutase